MFDLGFAELLVIGIVALIVVGPKDLPVMFRHVGRFVGRMRRMAREFSSAMNQAAEESGAQDIQKMLKTATDPVGTAMAGVKDAAKSFTDLNLDPDSETGKLAAEREEQTKKIRLASARAAADRMTREAAEARRYAEAMEAEMDASKPKDDA
ncbi:MAG: twin-arginine translocase subunit TatB [Rhodobacteraceae bacterium]|nr:twin-arginine translocase subunit TatB [Paracoccaceae bacterium]